MSDISNQYDLGNPGYGDNYISPSQVYEDTQVNPPNKNPGGLPGSSVYADSHTDRTGAVAPVGTPATAGATTAQGFSLDGLSLGYGSDGKIHIFGERRTLVADPADPHKTIYGYEDVDLGAGDDLQAVATASGLPLGAIQGKLPDLQAQWYQTGRTITQAGQYTIQGKNSDGTYNLVDYNGRVTPISATDLRAGMTAGKFPGVTDDMVNNADAQAGTTRRTTTQMGQYTVVGMSSDGSSLTVRDYYGNLSNVSADDAQAGRIPGVSYSDWQNAKADFVTRQRTLTQSGQFTVPSAQYDSNGNLYYNKTDYNGTITRVPAAQFESDVAAGKVPGVTTADLQAAKYKAVDAAWQQSSIYSNPFFGNGYGNSPTQPPGQQPSPPAQTPNPAPPAQGGAAPGATPNPTPTSPYAGLPSTPGASPTPTPTLNAYAGGAPGGTSGQQAPAGYQGGPAGPAPTGAFGASLMSQQAPAGYKDTSGPTAQTPNYAQQQAYSGAATGMVKQAGNGTIGAPNDAPLSKYSGTPTRATGGTLNAYSNPPPAGQPSPQDVSAYGAAAAPYAGLTHQQQGLLLQAYQNNTSMIRDQNVGNRNLSGMGFSGVQRPTVAGY